MKRLAALFAITGCAAGIDSPGDDDPPPDGGNGCSVFLTFDPPGSVEAGAPMGVRAIANVLPQTGVATYDWQLKFENTDHTFMSAALDGSAISFEAPDVGVFTVTLDVSQPGPSCPTTSTDYNSVAPAANKVTYRLRVVPPNSVAAPPFEEPVEVSGGGDASVGTKTLDPGIVVTSTLKSQLGANVAAYLRFMPATGRDAFVESFSGLANATFSARLRNVTHDVLVVPSSAGVAPRLVRDWSPLAPAITIDDGVAFSGSVLDAGGAGLAGAKVRAKAIVALGPTIVEVPSTLATTAANGAFTVRGSFPAGATVEFEVTPPAGSGLARLTGSSDQFDLAQPVTIRYTAVAQRNLSGVPVRRATAALGGAKVFAVGTFANRGTVTVGTTAVSATGEFRIEATANGAGLLPSTLVPALDLDAVIQISAGDFAVADLDLTAQVPAQLDAPPMVSAATQLQKFDGAGVAGIVVDAVPVGALALAGAPAVHASSGDGGGTTLRIAAGGTYDLHVSDPIGRGASKIEEDVSSGAVAASYKLAKHLSIKGALVLGPTGTPIGNASVQLLCATCTGVARSRPVGEEGAGIDGKFDIAVPDPGTMQQQVMSRRTSEPRANR